MLKTTTLPESAFAQGITEQVCLETDMDTHVEELWFSGYTVLENVVPSAQIAAAREKMDALETGLLAEMKTAGLKSGEHDGVIRYPLLQDNLFLELATLPPVLALLRRCLGPHFVLIAQTGILNRADKTQSPRRFHRDLNYQHWTIGGGCMGLNFLIAIDDFTEKNGATMALPGTHFSAPFPSEKYARKHETMILAPAGSVIVMNAMLFHRTGDNQTSSVRRGLNHVVGRPFMSPYVDLPVALAQNGKDFSGDEFLNEYLGYRWKPATSVLEWHTKRQS